MKKENVEYRLEEFLKESFGSPFIRDKHTIAVSCLQFGDTGKGKFVDLFAIWADIIVRPTGGNNAGHTIIYQGKELVLHLIPCGITDPNKINIIGSGTVIDVAALIREIIFLQNLGFDCNNLRISLKAKVILPSHVVLDRLSETKAGKGRVGTTGKGIGPCYADYIARRGLTMNDLLNPESLRVKLKKALDYHTTTILAFSSPETVKEIMQADDLGKGQFIGQDELFNFEAIYESYVEYGKQLSYIIEDTEAFVRANVGKKNILLEGAQGYLLSVDYGTYPYVTSSDCSPAGMAKGAGLKESDIDVSFGIIKGLYMTRVGKGAFPTEIGGADSEAWCNEGGSKIREQERFPFRPDNDSLPFSGVNDHDPFVQGIALRQRAGEYGATTGRPRRVGWLDLPLLRYALNGGANNLILTKLDILSGLDKIMICDLYEYNGPDYYYGDRLLQKGDPIKTAIIIPEVLDYCTPIYREFLGWKDNIREARAISDLPIQLLQTLKGIFDYEKGATVRILSVGPAAEETIFVSPGDL